MKFKLAEERFPCATDKVVLWYWASWVSLGPAGLVWAGMQLCTVHLPGTVSVSLRVTWLGMRVAGVSKWAEDFSFDGLFVTG